MKRRQYRGRLGVEAIAAGMTATSENANRLLRDAESLLREGRYASATALGILAIEEVGKVSILRELAVARTDVDVKEAWRNYRTHTKKNFLWIIPELIQRGARTLDEMRPSVTGTDHNALLDRIKRLAIYTDCIGDDRWSSPATVIDEELAKALVGIATVLCRGRATSADEVRLWIKQISPTWRGPLPQMKECLLRWDTEMRLRGLQDASSPSMAEFLGLSGGREVSRSGGSRQDAP